MKYDFLAYNLGCDVISEALDAAGGCDIKYLFHIILYSGEKEDVTGGLWFGIFIMSYVLATFFLDLHIWESVILKNEYLLLVIQQAFMEYLLNAMLVVSLQD